MCILKSENQCLRWVVLKLEYVTESPGGLVKTQIAGSPL